MRRRYGPGMAVVFAVALAGCATGVNQSALRPGEVRVEYSTSDADLPMLDAWQREVVLVNRGNAADVFQRFTVDVVTSYTFKAPPVPAAELYPNIWQSMAIPDVKDRSNLQNPVPTRFVAELQDALNARIARDKLAKGVYRNPVLVSNGRAALFYESRAQLPQYTYRLALQLAVYRRSESGAANSTHMVNCSGKFGEAQPLAHWAQGSYRHVKRVLDAALLECRNKVVAQAQQFLDTKPAF